jgi:phage tail-like protein
MSVTPPPDESQGPEEPRAELSRRVLIGGAAVGTLGLAATALKGVLPGEASAQELPDEGCLFALQIEGFFNARFPHVSGLGSESIPEDGQTIIKKIPGRLKWSDIELKRGLTAQMDVWAWRKMVEDGRIDEARKNGDIVLQDPAGHEVARWTFENAWPSKVSVQSGESDQAPCAWELLTLQVDSVRRVNPTR